MTHLCVTPERGVKTRRIMRALKGTFPEGQIHNGVPNKWPVPFVVWGHLWAGEQLVPRALEEGVPFWFVDNGYWLPARGTEKGYYSVTYRSTNPMLLESPDMSRLSLKMKPWKKERGDTILICVPGAAFGHMFGWDMKIWAANIIEELKQHTDRRIVVRDKSSSTPLEEDMARAHVMITHSSKAAVNAVLEGIPCIVEPGSAAAPVCGTDLSLVENPWTPSRKRWWASLMCQQFTLDEMRNGYARQWLFAAQRQGEREIQSGIPVMSKLVAV